jgi:hypothetical protein
MDILQLRTELETLLVNNLGVYTLANGAETPAIAVRAVGERSLPGTTVTGIELIIIRDPDLEPIDQYSSPAALRTWTLYLVDWDNNQDLEGPAARILEHYPSTTIAQVVVPEGVGPKHQLRLTVQTNPARTVDCA